MDKEHSPEKVLGDIAGAIKTAATFQDKDDIRSDLVRTYLSEPYGDLKKITGKSGYVSSDASDVVEAKMPQIMEVFAGSQNLLEFEPMGPDDVDAAKQESRAVRHVFWHQNRGFELLYCYAKDALMVQNGYFKSGWVEKDREEIESYDGLTVQELLLILNELDEAGVEYRVIDGEGFDATEQGLEQTGPEISATIRMVTREKRYEINVIPFEEIFYTPRWPNLSFDGIPCCGHRRMMEIGELRAMGFSERSIEEAAAGSDDDRGAKSQRFDTEDFSETDLQDQTGALREVMVYEAYVRCDIDGDGRAELVRAWAVNDGDQFLRWATGEKDEHGNEIEEDAIEEVPHHPFSCGTPYIMPHRHVGRSEVEQVDDIQTLMSVLGRHTLDNLYATGYPRPVYNEQAAGLFLEGDLKNPAPGAAIRTGGAVIDWQMPESVIGTTLPIMQMLREQREERTGTSRLNQGLNADSLNKQSEATVGRVMDAGTKRQQLIARTLAETGLRELFLKIHKDLRNGPLRQLVMRLDGQFIEINPRTWRHRSDMTVQVGIGRGDRDEMRAAFMMVKQAQQELMMAGSRMVDESRLYNTARDMAETFGMEGIERYFHDPQQLPPPPPPEPDPAEIMAKFEMEMRQSEEARKSREMEMRHAEKMAEIQLKQQQVAAGVRDDTARLELDRDKAVLEDDRVRDVEEMKAVTGYMRDQAKAVSTTPPMDYGAVGR